MWPALSRWRLIRVPKSTLTAPASESCRVCTVVMSQPKGKCEAERSRGSTKEVARRGWEGASIFSYHDGTASVFQPSSCSQANSLVRSSLFKELPVSLPEKCIPRNHLLRHEHYIMAGKSSSLHSSTLLTPPETPRTLKDSPFKPRHDDVVSLTMKRRHKRHGKEALTLRECLSDHDVKGSFASKQSMLHRRHIKSLPDLRGSRMSTATKASPQPKVIGSGCSDTRRRRWTLPSKAASTTFLANAMSTAPVQAQSKQKKQATKVGESPATITLRRATNSISPPRKMSLTFFPEPTFQRSKSGFLSSFLNTLTRTETKSDPTFAETYQPTTRRSSRSASVDNGKAQPSTSESAPPVCTQVAGVEPRWSIPGKDGSDFPPRRCSTRFISAGAVYEVIWDENGSSTSSESLPAQHEPESELPASGRRRSVAVEKLESQLFKAVAPSRRQSVAAAYAQSSRSTSNASNDPLSSSIGDFGVNRRRSVDEILAFHMGQPVQDLFFSHLHGPSRSKSIMQPVIGSPTISTVDEEASGLEDTQRSGAVEFFPPLQSRATTNTSKPTTDPAVNALASKQTSSRGSTPPDPLDQHVPNQTGGIGSMIGVSSHMRRRSTIKDGLYARRRSNALKGVGSRRSSAFIHPKTEESDEDDTRPLLRSSVGMFNSWNT